MAAPRDDATTSAEWSLLGCALVVRIALAWAPIEFLLEHVLPDDAFYYLAIARNAAHGAGASFDGLAATTGFHPLWLAMLVPLFAAGLDGEGALHGALTMSAVIDVVGVALLLAALRGLGVGLRVRLGALALQALAPALLTHAGTLNGLETSLAAALVSALILACVPLLRSTQGTPSAVAIGIIAGLLVLARLDAAILVVALGVACAWLGGRRAVAPLARAAGVCALVVLPWPVWCVVTSGSPLPVSARAGALIGHRMAEEAGFGLYEFGLHLLQNLADFLRVFPVAGMFRDATLPAFVAMALLLGAAAVASRLRRRSPHAPHQREATALVAAAVCGVTVLIAANTARMVFVRSWYASPAVPLAVLAAAVALDRWWRTRPMESWWRSRGCTAATGAGLVLAMVWSVPGAWRAEGGHVELYRMALRLDERLPAGTRVGAWNAGALGYFCRHVTVVNLDGLVNEQALERLRARDLEGYCAKAGITHLADYEGTLRAFASSWSADGRAPRILAQFTEPVPGSDGLVVAGPILGD